MIKKFAKELEAGSASEDKESASSSSGDDEYDSEESETLEETKAPTKSRKRGESSSSDIIDES